MNTFAVDIVLWILASPILLVQWLARMMRQWRFWQMAYTPELACPNCRETISLVGMWRCSCGYTYRGHLLRECPICHGLPRMVRCFGCGITEKLPEP